MNKIILCALGFFLVFSEVQGQISQVVVIRNGLTQKYELASQGITDNYKVLHVLTSDGSTKFSPEDIDGFQFENGRKYLSLKERNSDKKSFFQLPFEGEVSLAYLESNFYLVKDREAILLSVDNRLSMMEQSRKHKRKTYLGILHVMLNACEPSFSEKINSTNLSYPSLEKLLIAYHECLGATYQINGEKEKYIEFGISASIGLSSFKDRFDSKDFDDQVLSIRPEVLLTMDLNKLSPRFRAEIGLGYFAIRDSWVFGPRLDPGREREYYEEDFKLRVIQFPINLNYKVINQTNQDLYFGIGVSLNLLRKEFISEISQYEYMQGWEPYRVITRPRDPVLLEVKNPSSGVIFKVGYTRKMSFANPFIEMQYEILPEMGYLDFGSRSIYKYSLNAFSGKLWLRF